MSHDQQTNERNEENSEHHHEGHRFEIQIDRAHYTVTLRHMTGLELRRVPPTPIGPDRDLFEVVPGGSDRKIGDEDVVDIRNGLRFFTAPAQINPGVEGLAREHCVVATR